MRLAPDGRFYVGAIHSLWLDGTGVPHVDHSERAAALMRRLSHTDFGGRMRFRRVGTMGHPRRRRER